MGGYKIGDTPIFVVTPTRRPNRRGYEAAQVVADLDKSRGASRRATARAAWVLSKYGGYRDARQAAAVDAAVYHLLVGGRWRIDHHRGAARIRHSGDPASVRRYARIMLGQSRKFAGVYRVTVTATSADVGGTIEATVNGHRRATTDPRQGFPWRCPRPAPRRSRPSPVTTAGRWHTSRRPSRAGRTSRPAWARCPNTASTCAVRSSVARPRPPREESGGRWTRASSPRCGGRRRCRCRPPRRTWSSVVRPPSRRRSTATAARARRRPPCTGRSRPRPRPSAPARRSARRPRR